MHNEFLIKSKSNGHKAMQCIDLGIHDLQTGAGHDGGGAMKQYS